MAMNVSGQSVHGGFKSSRADGWWYPWLFVIGLSIVVAVNALMAYLALATWTGVESHPFRRGVAYNKNIEAARAQKAMHWSFGLNFTFDGIDKATGKHKGAVSVTFHDKDGQPLDGLNVRAMFVRPTSAGHDQTVMLKALAPGRYGAAVALPLPGLWDVRVIALGGKTPYQHVTRIQTP